MNLLIFGYTVIFLNWNSVSAIRNLAISAAFKSSQLVGDILQEAPKYQLNVYYPSATVSLGLEIKQTRTIMEPTLEYTTVKGCRYTLIMINPDAPSVEAPALRSYLVWLRVNIPGGRPGLLGGDTLAAYVAPTPYPGSGTHRYVFLLFEQTKDLNMDELLKLRLGVKRLRFDLEAFTRKNGLVLEAGNFFTSRVPALQDEYYCDGGVNCQIAVPL